MGYFEIDLPENKKGEVRWGTARKMRFSFFRKKKSDSEKGYIVSVTNANSKMEYRLFKSQNGEWSRDPEGKIKLEDSIYILIKNAIIAKEEGHT
jgi:hypothetical protein